MKPAIKALIRKHYLEINGYISAGMEVEKTQGAIFLNANENPYALPELEGLNRYPDPQPRALRAALAETYSVLEDEIIMTRGADEAIVTLIKLFCEPHQDKILICPPTFGMYKVDASAMPAEHINIPLREEGGTFTLDHNAIINAATNPDNAVKLVFLCSPNNPTGTSFDQDIILQICRAVEGHAMVILDETYAEFAQAGSLCESKSHTRPDNLIILRTLSKSYALAGIRLGSLISTDTAFTALIRAKAIEAYPLPRPTISAALHALSPKIKSIAHANIQKILRERERITPLLNASKHITHIYPSDANFLLIKMNAATAFCTFAAKHNIILRDFSNTPLTQNCLRIAIGTPQENDAVLKLLGKFEEFEGEGV